MFLFVFRASIPVIRCLHQKIIANTHRFGKYVHLHFKEFKLAVDADASWKQFLMDGGEGQPPIKYLALVEKGLRSFGPDVHAMGSGAFNSASRWKKVHLWRKREAYVALVRFILQRPSYQQWDCYKWQDYIERKKCNRTFTLRHLPLSDGDDSHFRGHIKNPDSWYVCVAVSLLLFFDCVCLLRCRNNVAPPRKRRKRSNKPDAPSAAPSVPAAVPDAPSRAPMMWDVDKDKFVPFE